MCSGPFSGADANWYRLSQVSTLTPQDKKGQRVAASKLSTAPDLCQLLNHAGYPHGDSLGQKHIKSYANNLPRQLQSLGVFPGHPFMMEDMSQAAWAGHIQKDPRNHPWKWHYFPARTWSAATKLSCSNLHVQFQGPMKVCSFYFPKVRRLFWSVTHVTADHISVLIQREEPGDQTGQDRMFLESLGELQRNSRDFQRELQSHQPCSSL